jgi:hypothetical protein
MWLLWVFVFHFLTFAFWLALVHTSFVTSDSATQKGVTFLVILIQKAVTDIQMACQCCFVDNSYGSEIYGGIFDR